jgi:hypothetical protein
MSKEFSHRQKFIESCNQLVLRLEEKELNENIVTDYANKLFDNIRTVKEIGDFYKKLLTNNKALQYYLTNLKNSIVKNINQINNDFLDKLLTTLNTTPSLKNLIYLSTLACATFYYIKSYQSIPNLETWFNSILNSQLINNITIDSILQFFEILIKIVGSIVLVYQILIEPYKNQILNYIIGSINLNKQNQMTESRFTNYNKTNMKKVRITESQLRGMVKKMIRENVEFDLKSKGFNDNEIQNIKSKTNNFKDIEKLNFNNPKLDKETINSTLEPFLKNVPMGMTTISESQLRGMVRQMLNEMNGAMPMQQKFDNTSTEKEFGRVFDRNRPLQDTLRRDKSVVGGEIDGIILRILKLMNIETKNLPNIKAGLLSAYNKLAQEKLASNAPQSFANTPQLEESKRRRKF